MGGERVCTGRQGVCAGVWASVFACASNCSSHSRTDLACCISDLSLFVIPWTVRVR